MVKISEEVWKKILENQQFPLIGSNEPNDGNGFNDRISWRIGFRPQKDISNEKYSNTFFSIYLRDLGLIMNPNLHDKKDSFENGLKLKNCTKNYHNTFLKYFSDRHYRFNDILYQLSHWAEYFSITGRLIFEIIGWYDNETKQFYAFELNRLDNEYCKVGKEFVIYEAPFDLDKNKEIFKRVKIPITKCIIIDFPNEFSGYKGFNKKGKQVLSLGQQFILTSDPKENLDHSKHWDKEFNKIISNWGGSMRQENITEYYQELNAFRFTYLARLCTLKLINGLKQLINYLNIALGEEAELDLNIQEYDMQYFRDIQHKWEIGELSFKDANKFLRS